MISAIQVVLADRDPLALVGLRSCIAAAPRIRVVGQASTGPELIDVARASDAQVVVAEVALMQFVVDRKIRALRDALPAVRCIALTRRHGPFGLPLPPAPDADLHLFREDDLQILPRVIADLHDGVMVPPVVAGERHAGPGAVTRGDALLTTREIEVLRLLAVGESDDDIGARLGISARTVESHRVSARRRLRIETSRQLMVYAAYAFATPASAPPPAE